MIQGSGTRGNVGTYKYESLPNTTGSFSSTFIPTAEGSVTGYGVFSSSVRSSYSYHGFTNWDGAQVSIMFDNSKSSPTYQNDAPVQQNALLIQCCIKY